MKKSRFTESQIVAILQEVEAGMKVKEICRKHGISDATYYNRKMSRHPISGAIRTAYVDYFKKMFGAASIKKSTNSRWQLIFGIVCNDTDGYIDAQRRILGILKLG